MRAKGIVLRGGKQTDLLTAEVAEPGGSQVLIRTHAVGLCGSDVSLYQGTYEGPKNYPLYFGHEWSGTVEAVGPDVARLQPGDRVTGDCSLFCGTCQFCRHDKNLCQHIEKFGITRDGASRQFFLQDERYLYRADPGADLDLVALSEPLAVGAHAVQRVRQVRPNLPQEKVLVVGGGPIGLACLLALKLLEGCEHVELYDLVPERVNKAVAAGADQPGDVVLGGREAAGAVQTYGGLYSGQGYDAIFETSAAPAAFRQAIGLLRPLGTLMTLGFIPAVEFSPKQLTFKAAQIMGSIGGTGEFDRVLGLVARYPELARQLISHHVSYEQVDQAFALAADRGQSMKVLVHFE